MRSPSCFAGRRRVGANEPTSSNFWAIFAVTLLLAAGASAFSVVSLSVRGGASHQYNALAIGREMASRGHRFTILLAKGETTRVGDQVTIVSRDPETYARIFWLACFFFFPPRCAARGQCLSKRGGGGGAFRCWDYLGSPESIKQCQMGQRGERRVCLLLRPSAQRGRLSSPCSRHPKCVRARVCGCTHTLYGITPPPLCLRAACSRNGPGPRIEING